MTAGAGGRGRVAVSAIHFPEKQPGVGGGLDDGLLLVAAV